MIAETPQRREVLPLAGALEIGNAEELRLLILERLPRCGELVLDLNAVETCDAAGLQLLCAARVSATRVGKVLRFERVPPPVAECCTRLGLSLRTFDSPAAG